MSERLVKKSVLPLSSSAHTGPLDDSVSLESLERILARHPENDAVWQEYESCLSRRYGSDLPEDVWKARQFLICLRSELADAGPLNDLTAHYEAQGKGFNAMLCRLASLSADPAQPETYEAARRAYDQGVLEPTPFTPTEPIECTVSVILATYNRPDLLRHAIASVLDQTFQDFELLVVNDGGTREAKSVVESFDSPKIRYFYKEEQGGHRSALNVGLRAARGRYIAYLDDDDVYFPHHLQTVVEAAEAEELDFVCSRNRWVKGRWEDGRWIETEDLTQQKPFSVKRLHASAVIADLTVLHTRSLVERVGLFWEDPQRGGEWEYWVRCSHHVPIKRLDAVTAEVRGSTLPTSQPARAQVFTRLWRMYFGSAFGEVVLATAAWYNGDEDARWQHIERIGDFYQYLSAESLKRLWQIGVADQCPRECDLLKALSRTQPKHVGLQLYRDLVSRGRWHIIRRFPLAGYVYVGGYLLRNPNVLLSLLS